MFFNNRRITFFAIVAITYLSRSASPLASAQQQKKPLTLTGEIGLTLFGTPGEVSPELDFSPDGNYFVVWTQRGRLDLNRVEDSLRIYSCKEVKHFLKKSRGSQAPSPVWIVNRSDNEGPIIADWHWLADSSGVAFLERTAGGNQRLVLADLRKKTVEPLTRATEMVKTFDVCDRQHYVYTVADPAEREKLRTEGQAPAIVGTGQPLYKLLFPNDPKTVQYVSHRSYLWAVFGNKRFEVKRDGAPLVLEGYLALSPDGQFLVTKMPVSEVPRSWETLYPPPFVSDPFRTHAGGAADQYVLINVQTGSIRTLTDAPSGNGSWAYVLGSPKWSKDGQAILLPRTFLKSQNNTPSRPCIAVVDISSNTRTCVVETKGRTENGVEEGYHLTKEAHFAAGDKRRVVVSFFNGPDQRRSEFDYSVLETIEYQQAADGIWQVAEHTKGAPRLEHDDFEVTVKQSLNEPPLLVAKDKYAARIIWNPNPELKNFELGQASVYKWKDIEGRTWKGGLYKPIDYKPGQRYPLVIQTHGFDESYFWPSGGFSTANAARALAASGIVVLQVGDYCPTSSSANYLNEGPCGRSIYESAATQLASEGLVDPENIGIVGFSRTCFYVMQTLTTGSTHFKAASITDGVMENYLQYMLWGAGIADDANLVIGAKPFGVGLELWLKRSSGFNLDKITTPLLVVGEGPISLLGMWEPYAGLRYLHDPVDLMMLNTDEHVLTNPAVRLASQRGSVDWFRFWLQNYEDPDPAKAEQYTRWRDLRKMQAENEKKSTTPQPASN